jgi:uncharacterized protein YjdB
LCYFSEIYISNSHFMKRLLILLLIAQLMIITTAQSPIIIDHTCTRLYKIPDSWIDAARANLHIAYGHTSHGSQLISGMTGLNSVYGSDFAFNNGGIDGALDIHDEFAADDLGYPDFVTWAARTREYLNNPDNADVNVVIWSWCGEVTSATQENIDTYLSLMNQLELDYPDIKFVYMTGHLDGSGESGNLNVRNEQIRTFCKNNNKVLYDFADIESYDPSGLINFMILRAKDNCDYDSDNNWSWDSNWAIEWSDANPDSCFFFGECAHSQSLNCQQKGIAAWWLWTRLAGWNGPDAAVAVTNITITGANGATTITSNGGTLQLSAAVLPENATNKTVTWSIQNGTGQALINSNGLVSAIANGAVTAKATATDGSGVNGSMVITISGQTVAVTGIIVTAAGGATTITSNGGTLQLYASITPYNATNKTVIWSIKNGTGQASISTNGLVTAITDGSVTAKATANDNSGVSGSLGITILTAPVIITTILVYGEDFKTTISTPGGTLQLHTNILPANATDKSVTWSLQNGTGQASIDTNGLLTAIADGTVTVKATANDGSGVHGILIITIENQNLQTDIKENDSATPLVTISQSRLIVQLNENNSFKNISLYNMYGNLISNQKVYDIINTYDVSTLSPGVYIVVLSGIKELINIKIMIP